MTSLLTAPSASRAARRALHPLGAGGSLAPGWAAVLMLALVVRASFFLVPGVLRGRIDSDDGVYFGAAVNLVHGQLPYRDFLLVHPPGSTVLLAPLAALGSVFGQGAAFTLARLLVVLVAVVTTHLVMRVTLRLAGPSAAIVAGVAYACLPGAVVAEHTVMLEPFVNLFAAAGLCVLVTRPGRRTAVYAGVLFGAATSVKLFGAVYPIAVGAWLLWRRPAREAGWLLLGTAASAAAVCVPFLLAARGTFVHDVVISQLNRPTAEAGGVLIRLADLSGLRAVLGYADGFYGLHAFWGGAPVQPPALLVLPVVLALGAAGAWTVMHRRDSLETALVVALAGIAVAFSVSGSFFTHYSAVAALPLAVLVGTWAGRSREPGLPALRWVGIGVVLLAVVGTMTLIRDPGKQQPPFGAEVAARVPRDACLVSDTMSMSLLADRFGTAPGCPVEVDQRGRVLALEQADRMPEFYPYGFRDLPSYQQFQQRLLARADYVLLTGEPTRRGEWSVQTQQQFLADFQLTWHAPDGWTVQLWERRVTRP